MAQDGPAIPYVEMAPYVASPYVERKGSSGSNTVVPSSSPEIPAFLHPFWMMWVWLVDSWTWGRSWTSSIPTLVPILFSPVSHPYISRFFYFILICFLIYMYTWSTLSWLIDYSTRGLYNSFGLIELATTVSETWPFSNGSIKYAWIWCSTLKVAGASYYNKILFITKHGNVCDVSIQFINS